MKAWTRFSREWQSRGLAAIATNLGKCPRRGARAQRGLYNPSLRFTTLVWVKDLRVLQQP